MWTVYRDERLFPFSELLGDCENVVDFDPYANFVWLVGTVPCVSIQLTLSQFAWQCFVWLVGTLCVDSTDPFSMLRGSVSCGSGQLGMRSRVSFLADLLAKFRNSFTGKGSGWSVPCVSIQLTLSQKNSP